jgi:hypothetical protein
MFGSSQLGVLNIFDGYPREKIMRFGWEVYPQSNMAGRIHPAND